MPTIYTVIMGMLVKSLIFDNGAIPVPNLSYAHKRGLYVLAGILEDCHAPH